MRTIKKALLTSLIAGALGLSSQAVHAQSVDPLVTSQEETKRIQELAIKEYKKEKMKESLEKRNQEVRITEMKKAYFAYHFQNAVIQEYDAIKLALKKHSSLADQNFPFRSYMLHGGKVQPPVIRRYNGRYEKFGDRHSRVTETSFEIVKEAKIVTVPPTWRKYLLKSFPKPKRIPDVLIPQNQSEWDIVNSEKAKAVAKGKEHARLLLDKGVALAKRDIEGISFFYALAEQNIVSVPKLSEGRVGIKIKGKMLDVNQKTFVLNDVADFNKETKWKPVISSMKTNP